MWLKSHGSQAGLYLEKTSPFLDCNVDIKVSFSASFTLAPHLIVEQGSFPGGGWGVGIRVVVRYSLYRAQRCFTRDAQKKGSPFGNTSCHLMGSAGHKDGNISIKTGIRD